MSEQNPRNEKLIPAKKGQTLAVGTALIHSRYDPEAEAEKYIASLELNAFPFFILIEPGLGYLKTALQKKFSSSIIITIHCSSFFNDNNDFSRDPLSWNPALPETLEDFLERLLENTGASAIKLVDWKPSINAYGKAALDITSRAVECIRRINAGKKTARNFGRRWIRNALRNLEMFSGGTVVERGSVPVLVCAAGPSLEDSLDTITAWKESPSPPFLIAVSSAAPALLCRGIKPDIITSTDGGIWALFHLYESCRALNSPVFRDDSKPLIAAALTAALPSNIASWPIAFLRGGNLWEEILVKAACAERGTKLVFPQRGTVSVTALDLAFYLSDKNVYVCGLDFSHRDIKTHAKPSAFEHILERNVFRVKPLYSEVFKREAMIRSSGSHGIYKAWFLAHQAEFPGRLFALGASMNGIPAGVPPTVPPSAVTPLLDKTEKAAAVKPFQAETNRVKPRSRLRKTLVNSLIHALTSPLYSRQLITELGELLVDEESEQSHYAALIQNALLELL